MTRYVFVSHANLDKPTLKWVLEGLLAAGLPLWIDRPEEVGLADHRLVLPGIRPGADWDAEIRRAYEGSACVLFFLPRNSNNPARSDSLFREFDHGSANDKLVIAKLDDIDRDELSGLMRIRQALDLSGMGRDGSAGLKSLVSALRSYVPREAKGSREERPKRKMVEGAVVCTEITGAQASVHTLAKVLVDQMLPIVDGLYPLDPASNIENVAALKDVVRSQLTNLTSEIGFLGGPRVMRVQQYLQMLLGVTLNLSNVGGPPGGTAASVTVSQVSGPPANSPLALANAVLPAKSWSNPDFVLGSLGDLRDSLGLSSVPLKKIGRGRRDVISYINTVEDEQNVTNFRILVEYANSFLDVWVNNVQFFAAQQSQFPGAQLVVISRQLGVISETLDEVRVVLDSVFVGPAQRETLQILFESIPITDPTTGAIMRSVELPPIYLADLLQWMQDFVEAEAQDVIKNARKLGLREDFNTMITQIYCQAYRLYMFARSKTVPIAALSTPRVLESLYKLVNQLNDLFNMASHWRDLSAAASGDQSDNQKRRNRHESQHEELTEDGPANLESAAQRAPDAKLRGRTPSRP